MGYGFATATAYDTKQGDIVNLTIWLIIFFVERRRREHVTTDVAAKMLWMPDATAGSDTTAQHWFSALGARFLEESLVVLRTIESAFILVTVSSGERTAALLAAEMFWVHCLTLESDPLSNNWLLTTRAHLLIRIDGNDSLDVAIYAQHRHILAVFLCLILCADEFLTACEADEMLRVEEVGTRGNILSANDFFARATAVAE